MKIDINSIITPLLIFACVLVLCSCGMYIDIRDIADILIDTVLTPLYAAVALTFAAIVKIFEFNYSEKLTRQVVLQRVDPLLN